MIVVVKDLEATCWNDGTNDKVSETIEIGAVKVDLKKGEIIDRFQAFIKPIINPKLSKFCKELTTIRQADVDNARTFDEVYVHYSKWYGGKNKSILSAWGNYDKSKLMADCVLHNLEWRQGEEYWNIKSLYAARFGQEKMGLGSAVKFLNMEFVGTPHRAISDAENTANVLIRIFHDN